MQVAGRSDAQIRHDVMQAAMRVCAAADVLEPETAQTECVLDTTDHTMRQLARADSYIVATR